MIESVSDAIQLLVLAVCFALAIVRALRERSMAWVAIVSFFSCMLLGNAYWFGYLLVFGETPHYSYIAEMGWIAGYVFLLMILVEADKRRTVSAPIPWAWAPVIICAACCVYYIALSGSPLLNIADNGLMAAIGFFAVRGLAATPSAATDANHLANNRAFHVAALMFVVVEQMLWLSSCFLEPGPIAGIGPYIVIGFGLTLAYAVILACAWKSSDA